jgi:type IV pilus assembly protein PilO
MNLERFSLATLEDKITFLTPLQRVLLFVATFISLGAVFYYFQYQPQTEVITRLQANLSEQEKRLASLKQAAAQVPELQEALAKAEEDFSHLLSLLPDQKEIPALLDTISQLGAVVGLENILFQPQPEQVFEFYAAIPIRLDLVGSYHTLGAFFDSLSKLNRILKVENLSISRPKGNPLLQVACTIITYRFLDKPVEVKSEPKKK